MSVVNCDTIALGTAACGRLEEKSRYIIDISIGRYSKLHYHHGT